MAAIQAQCSRGNSDHGEYESHQWHCSRAFGFFSEQQKWQIDNSTSGGHYQKNKLQLPGFNNWDTTLYKRGFATRVDAWVAQVKTGALSNNEDILATHSLCEIVVDHANKTLSSID